MQPPLDLHTATERVQCLCGEWHRIPVMLMRTGLNVPLENAEPSTSVENKRMVIEQRCPVQPNKYYFSLMIEPAWGSKIVAVGRAEP